MIHPSDLLKANKVLFNKMKELAINQEKLISDDQIKGFLAISSQRERLRKEIDKNTAKYRSMAKARPGCSKEKGDRKIALEIAEVIGIIQEIDHRIEGYMAEKKDALFTEIKSHQKGKQALKGYGGHSPKKSKFLSATG